MQTPSKASKGCSASNRNTVGPLFAVDAAESPPRSLQEILHTSSFAVSTDDVEGSGRKARTMRLLAGSSGPGSGNHSLVFLSATSLMIESSHETPMDTWS